MVRQYADSIQGQTGLLLSVKLPDLEHATAMQVLTSSKASRASIASNIATIGALWSAISTWHDSTRTHGSRWWRRRSHSPQIRGNISARLIIHLLTPAAHLEAGKRRGGLKGCSVRASDAQLTGID
jgi:hypothetical protein